MSHINNDIFIENQKDLYDSGEKEQAIKNLRERGFDKEADLLCV